jgi:hypothetical protein
LLKTPKGDGAAVPFSLATPAPAQLILALLAVTLLPGCSDPPGPAAQGSGALASWEGGAVTIEQLDARVRQLPVARRRPPGGTSLAEWVENEVAELVLPQIVLARARESELAGSPALELRARFEASQEIGRDHLLGRCPAQEISESDLRAAFDSGHSGEPTPWVLVRHIYKRALPGLSDDERARKRDEIARLVRDLDEGVSFIELARMHSDSETAKDGGLLGRISRHAPIEPRVRDAAWALRDGEYSKVVEVENGFHVLLREEHGVEPPPTFEQVREELVVSETLRLREACGREVLRSLGDATPVLVDRDALLQSDDASRTALTIGDETFTVEALAGLSSELQPLLLRTNRGELLRRFSESVLLVRDAVAVDPAFEERYGRLRAAALEEALVEVQWRRDRRAMVANRPEPELRAHFEAHEDRFRTDLELDVGLILVSAGDGPGSRPALELAHALERRILAGESFEDLAAEASDHVSREDEGRLGPLPLPRLKVVLGSRGIVAATELGTGEVSPPVRIHDQPAAAFGLIKLYGRTEPQPRSFEEARDDVIETLSGERVRQLDAELRERLIEESGLVFHRRAIEEYVAELRG